MYTLDNPNIIHITEQIYRGIQRKHVENQGWKIVLGSEEYLFRNFQEAQFAIDRIHQDCENWYGGEKLKTKQL